MQEVIFFDVSWALRATQECGRYFPEELLNQCRSRWPELFPSVMEWCRDGACIGVGAPKTARVVEEAIAFLRQHGREPYLQKYPSCPYEHPTLYPVGGKRRFEPKDVDEAEYLILVPQKVITTDATKDNEGNLSIKRSKVNRQLIGKAFPSMAPVCKDFLKTEMESEGFNGLAFRSVNLPGTKALVEPVWAMSADREMPALLNRIVNDDGTDYEPNENRGCHVDDFYFPSLLRFPAVHVRAMEPFDAAITKEREHHKWHSHFTPEIVKRFEPFLIVSRRFRKWCDQRKLKIEWWPVVLE